MGRRKHVPGAPATTEQLIAAAAAAFGSKGYEGARLEDIAEAAGITRPSLLHHFPSKKALFSAALERAFLLLRETVHRALSAESETTGAEAYEMQVRVLVDALLAFDVEHRAMLAMMFRGVLREDEAVRAAVRAHFLPLVDDIVQRLRRVAGAAVPDAYPLRGALLTLIVSQLTHSALGEFGEELWGGVSEIATLGPVVLAVR